MTNQKGIINLAIPIVIAAVLIGVVAFGYFYWLPKEKENNNTNQVVANTNSNENENENENSSTNGVIVVNASANANANTNSAVDTTGWKTYENNDYKFKFKYPQYYQDISAASPISRQKDIYMTETDSTGTRYIKYRSSSVAKLSFQANPTTEHAYPILQGSVFLADEYRFVDVSGGVEYGYDASGKTWWENDTSGKKNAELQTIKFNNLTGYRFRAGDAGSGNFTIAVVSESNSYILEISMWIDPDTQNKDENVLDKIFKTIEFTKETACSDGWSTYTNQKYGYTVKYPNTMTVTKLKQIDFSLSPQEEANGLTFAQKFANYGEELCVTFKISNTAYATIAAPANAQAQVLCGRTGVGAIIDDIKRTDPLTIEGANYTGTGDIYISEDPDTGAAGTTLMYKNETNHVLLSDSTSIEYGSTPAENILYTTYEPLRETLICIMESYKKL